MSINTDAVKHRRLARRGGVKRISAGIYDEVRVALKSRLEQVCSMCTLLHLIYPY